MCVINACILHPLLSCETATMHAMLSTRKQPGMTRSSSPQLLSLCPAGRASALPHGIADEQYEGASAAFVRQLTIPGSPSFSVTRIVGLSGAATAMTAPATCCQSMQHPCGDCACVSKATGQAFGAMQPDIIDYQVMQLPWLPV